MAPASLEDILRPLAAGRGRLVALTGAGISAESGIPTFRGEEGYWSIGSRNYRPEQLATHAAFQRHPRGIWHWYLYRRSVCRAAGANAGHRALAQIEHELGPRFSLVTQNVDGLHTAAGSNAVFEIHGNIDRLRCAVRCTDATHPIPAVVGDVVKGEALPDGVFEQLRCPDCGAPARPHVLWFDECYDEALFGASSAFEAGARASVLLVVGTSGATSLPIQIGMHCMERGIPIIDVNPADNPFGQLAERSAGGGVLLRTTAADALVRIAKLLTPA